MSYSFFRRAFVLSLFALAVVTSAADGQTAADAEQGSSGAADSVPPAFEVTSVKMVSPEEAQGPNAMQSAMPTYPTAHFSMHYATLVTIMVAAYGTDGRRVEKRPDWNEEQLYNVDAAVAGGRELTKEQMQPLLQQLLEQRFHLRVHREMRAVKGYEMVVGPGGPTMTPEELANRPPGLPPAFYADYTVEGIRGWGVTMERLAHVLVTPVGKPVVDKTGLTGRYDIDMKYRNSADDDRALPSVFEAVQEQLGLKLVPAKLQLDYLVIDHSERVPEAN
jgi:uncharacterized protein (TIGR03435 family)